ncbi:MAG: class I SAM-dependent methyltransferase [Proteobacteria bacterium]|nr:class I SAM-dependent methyltransferase [Pseudomonadota bacterium]
MARRQLFEIEDQPWCPSLIRDGITDALEFHARVAGPYRAIADRLFAAIRESGAERVVDLCSGGGGPWIFLSRLAGKRGTPLPEILLTDLFPNRRAFDRARDLSGGVLTPLDQGVDATRVPEDLSGFRTLFSGLHHFPPQVARAILADAVDRGQGIGVFEFVGRHPSALAFCLATPWFMLTAAPFFGPLSARRFLFTYVAPAIPLAASFDGVVSCLRAYSPAELRDLTRGLGNGKYRFEIGTARGFPWSMPVTYLLGVPKG